MKCKKGLHFLTVPVCAACEYNQGCETYSNSFKKNPERTLQILRKYVEKYEKYKIGVVMADKKMKERYMVVLRGKEVLLLSTEKNAKAAIAKDPDKFTGATIITTSVFQEPVFTLTLRADPKFLEKVNGKSK